MIDEAEKIARSSTPIVEVIPLRKVKIGLVITGNEVFYGRIEDRFEEVLRAKVTALGSEILHGEKSSGRYDCYCQRDTCLY